MDKLGYDDKFRIQTLREQRLGSKAIIKLYHDKNWKCVRSVVCFAVQSMRPDQPWYVNLTVDGRRQRELLRTLPRSVKCSVHKKTSLGRAEALDRRRATSELANDLYDK